MNIFRLLKQQLCKHKWTIPPRARKLVASFHSKDQYLFGSFGTVCSKCQEESLISGNEIHNMIKQEEEDRLYKQDRKEIFIEVASNLGSIIPVKKVEE